MDKIHVPSPLYKYRSKAHAESMVNEGVVVIGTLEDYKNMTKYGSAIGDSQEGISTLTFPPGPGGTVHIESRIEQDGHQSIKDVTFTVTGNISPGFKLMSRPSRDHYIYCTASVFSEDAMKEFGCDSCVIIDDPANFFKSITDALEKEGYIEKDSLVITAPCVYQQREDFVKVSTSMNMDLRNKPAPYLIKEPQYEYQSEVRTLWKPKQDNPKPFLIKCEEITKFCRIHM